MSNHDTQIYAISPQHIGDIDIFIEQLPNILKACGGNMFSATLS